MNTIILNHTCKMNSEYELKLDSSTLNSDDSFLLSELLRINK